MGLHRPQFAGRPRRSDLGNASRGCRSAQVDQRRPIRPRPELLPPVARPRSSAAGHLPRLAHAWREGWSCRRDAIRPTRFRGDAGSVDHLRRVRVRGMGEWTAFRAAGGGRSSCLAGDGPHCPTHTSRTCADLHRPRSISGAFCARSSLPLRDRVSGAGRLALRTGTPRMDQHPC